MAARNGVIIPNEVLSDISDFIPYVENLTFISKSFAAVTIKRLPIINAIEKLRVKIYMHSVFWKYRSIERHFNENSELTTEKLDEISTEYKYKMDKEQIKDLWAMLQEWSKEDKMDEDPFLALLQEDPLYKEDPEGFWAMATFGYASSHRMGTYEYMKFFLSLASPYLDTWEIIDVLYRENPELTVERRDQICADFHIDKILIEAHWNAYQRSDESQQGKPSPFWEWPKNMPQEQIDQFYGIEEDRHIEIVKWQALWCHLQRYHQRITEKSFKENPKLTMERLIKISACSSARLMQGSGYGIDKELIEGYWSVLQRRSKQNARADETI